MKKRLRFFNGFRYGELPININLVRLIERQRVREALAGQLRAFESLQFLPGVAGRVAENAAHQARERLQMEVCSTPFLYEQQER